jgi:H3 lysine-79-specific histone-lysine N-methyltransferase
LYCRSIAHCNLPQVYLSPPQQALFGPLPHESFTDVDSPPSSPSPSPSPPHSRASTSSLEEFPIDPFAILDDSTHVPLLRALRRAINTQDGPFFLRALDAINAKLRSIKYPISNDPFDAPPPNPLMNVVESWTEPGLPKPVLMRVIDENYQRAVGPNVKTLKKYEAFSSTVYGELMPALSHEIIRLTQLREDSLFLDLGSGVANVVVQAALQTGCTAYGIELMPQPARVARDMAKQIRIRARMWGIDIGEIELEEGDMLKSKRVDELMSKADVVLVDNKVFEESCEVVCPRLDLLF